MNNDSKEWRIFCDLSDYTSRLAFAKNMKDACNRSSALRFLGYRTAKDNRISRARQQAIAQVKKSEIHAHCQFEGLPKI